MNESKTDMQEKSSAEKPRWPAGVRELMLLTNVLPLLHAVVCLNLMWQGQLVLALVCLYLVPPLLTRGWLKLRGIQSGVHSVTEKVFMTWWVTAQAQMIFNRLPFLEEMLRLVPGLYSLWMRLWGAKIGRLTFWGPHVRIVDRPLIIIGDDVVIGGGCQIGSHLLVRDESGAMTLQIAAVEIGEEALVGTYTMIGPGVVIEPRAEVRACAIIPQFNRWRGEKRLKPETAHHGE